jgi:aryl-alcohol dehydrogenase-like predicted oxidoreductase
MHAPFVQGEIASSGRARGTDKSSHVSTNAVLSVCGLPAHSYPAFSDPDRQEACMSSLRRRLGSSNLRVHPLCLGGNTFGWTTDRDASFAVLDRYVEAGGNFVDTADAYSGWVPGHVGGESETILGEWLARGVTSDDLIIATKVGSGAADVPKGLRREQIIAGCEASLRRLGVERIDLYYAHRDDPETPLDETLGAFDELVRAGKVAQIAASNYSPQRLREAVAISEANGFAAFSVLQPRLNLVDRADFVGELQAIAAEHDLGVAVYSALASGFLSGKYRPGAPEPESPRAGGVRSAYLSDDRALRLLEAARSVAAHKSATVAQIALAWALAVPGVTSAIASATTPEQLDELLGAVAVELDEHDLAELDRAA